MSQDAKRPVDPTENISVLAGVLSYLIPGLGQIYLGKVAKGVMFMVCLLGMFFAGQYLGDWQNVYLPDRAKGPDQAWRNNPWHVPFMPLANVVHHRWHYAGQFWMGIAAWPALWQYNRLPVPSEETNPILHNFQRAPESEVELNNYLADRDKMPDLAWVYTVIAGMLNILVIYDAFAGPAYGLGISRDKQKANQQKDEQKQPATSPSAG